MKILIDIRLLGRERYSGVAEYTFNLVDHLIKLASPKYHFQLFYNGLKKEPLPAHWLSAPNVSIINYHYPNKIINLASFCNFKIDRWLKTDLIFSPHIDLINSASTPRILTIHDLSFIHYKNFFSRKQRLWHYLQKIEKQIGAASLIITNSNYTKNDIVETLAVSEEKISVIYPGIATQQGDSLKVSRFQSLNLTLNSKSEILENYLLYLGTIEPRKNIPAIIKAFNILKSNKKYHHIKLVLAGKNGWLYKNVFQEAKQSSYQKDIIFLGPVTAEEKNMLYNSARVFVYPSFFEGFGFPPLEAQAHNCPVITSDRSSLPEILENSAIKVNPWKTNKLAEAIDKILSDQSLRQKLIIAGQKNIKRFNYDLCAAQLLEIFSGYF